MPGTDNSELVTTEQTLFSASTTWRAMYSAPRTGECILARASDVEDGMWCEIVFWSEDNWYGRTSKPVAPFGLMDRLQSWIPVPLDMVIRHGVDNAYMEPANNSCSNNNNNTCEAFND